MTPEELASVQRTIADLTHKLDAAEQRAHTAERERDDLRRLLARSRTSLNETVNDPATDGGVA